MYETIVNFCRYMFLLYISLFLLSGFLVSLAEKNIIQINTKKQFFLQKIFIILFHITAFIILSFNKITKNINTEAILFFIISIFILITILLLCNFTNKNSCQTMWNGILFLVSISFVMLYRLNPFLAFKQSLWVLIGFFISIILIFILNIMPKLELLKYLYLLLGLILLVSTLTFGNKKGGAINWLTINGFTFQPSEPVKILFIFYLSASLSKVGLKIKDLIFPSLMSFLFVILLVFQSDLGSALIFFMTYIVMVYISTSKSYIVFICSLLATFGSYIAYKFFNHVRIRVEIWKNPWENITGNGFQIAQSLFALGTFGFFGSGLNNGMPNSIPVVEKDLIFSAICEEFGVFFGISVILIFIMIFFRCVKISLNCKNNFLILVSSGITSILCFQTFLIIGGTIKFIPLTGVTLPFISYGGSSIIISFILIGILQWISSNNKKY